MHSVKQFELVRALAGIAISVSPRLPRRVPTGADASLKQLEDRLGVPLFDRPA